MVTDPYTPLPWVNIICPDDLGVAVTAAGDGFTWHEHAGYNMITRWIQDFSTQRWGKFIYLVDEEEGRLWSAALSPCRQEYRSYKAVHGIGYTEFIQVFAGIESRWKITVDPDRNIELWRLTLRNLCSRPRTLAVIPSLEWCLGRGAPHHRAIHECFFKTACEGNHIAATRSMWDVPGKEGHWNTPYPYWAFLATERAPSAWEFSKGRFLGRQGRIERPDLAFDSQAGEVSGSNDAIAALKIDMVLPARGRKSCHFMLGLTEDKGTLPELERELLNDGGFKTVERRVGEYWTGLFRGLQVETPDASLNLMANQWLKYQTFSSRVFGRSGYYIQGGGFGYREIQDLLVVIPLVPRLARERLLTYARNQYSNLTVPHYFDPLSGEKGPALWSDDVLWLPFIAVHYLKETGDFSLLQEAVPYSDQAVEDSFYLHCVKGLETVWNSRGDCGLPLIKEGDWNDGMSAVGLQGRGQSVWLGQFLAGILHDFIELAGRMDDPARAESFTANLAELKEVLNSVGWDGAWYRRARCDGGKWIGSKANAQGGKVFLNTQVWAILHDVVSDPARLGQVMRSLDEHLYTEEGPVLLSPPYLTPDPEIGYLTRYNPGVRENGGVYVHAANWALQAEAKLGRRDRVWYVYEKICPVLRHFDDPDRFQSEPYVTCGNIEYAPSPSVGKGAWSWYTSSGSWFYKVVTEHLLGIRPRYDGLEVCPQVPTNWKGFSVRRVFRGRTLHIAVTLGNTDAGQVRIDGVRIPETYIPERRLSRTSHRVDVIIKRD